MMVRPHWQRFASILLTLLVVAVAALAIAQSAHMQPMIPALVAVLAIVFLPQPAQATSRLPSAVLPFRRLPRGVITPHFAMPPPSAYAA